MHKFELSSKKSKSGKKYFKAVLHEIYPDDCVVGEDGTLFNDNGITYLEKYTKRNLGSIEDMSITVEFINDERTEIYGHGMTGIEDGIPIFQNATMIGNFTRAYVDDIEIDGEIKKCCIGEGYFDYMRYKDFIDIMQSRMENGEMLVGSIEFSAPEGKSSIEYLYGYKEKGRIPTDYDYTGYAILAIRPSDMTAAIVEINEKKAEEDNIVMDNEKMLQNFVEDIKGIVSETNNKNDELTTRISELNNSITAKDSEISKLNTKATETEDELKKKDEKINELNELVEKITGELNECKKENAINELNSLLVDFSEEEKEYAKAEIETFNEDPSKIELNSIVTKINATIGEKAKQAQIAEINSAKNKSNPEDIFSFIDEATDAESLVDLDNIFE